MSIRATLYELVRYMDEHQLWESKGVFAKAAGKTVDGWFEKAKVAQKKKVDLLKKEADFKAKQQEEEKRLKPYRDLFSKWTQMSEARALVELHATDLETLETLHLLNLGKKFIPAKSSKKTAKDQLIEKLRKKLENDRAHVL